MASPLPPEIALLIMRLLAARGWARTLLQLLLADRAHYAAGLSLLLRRVEVGAGAAASAAARFEGRRPPGTMRGAKAADARFVREVSVRLAGMSREEAHALQGMLMNQLRSLRTLEIDVADSEDPVVANWLGFAASAGSAREVVVRSAQREDIQLLLRLSMSWRHNGLLVFYPANPAQLGSGAGLVPYRESMLDPPPMARAGVWSAEIRGPLDCSARGGWTLEKQTKYWASYARSAAVIPGVEELPVEGSTAGAALAGPAYEWPRNLSGAETTSPAQLSDGEIEVGPAPEPEQGALEEQGRGPQASSMATNRRKGFCTLL